MIPQEFIYKYNLKEKGHNENMLTRITKGVYGLPQAVRITHDTFIRHLEPYVHHTSSNTLELWTHNSNPIRFILVVDDFGVKFSGK